MREVRLLELVINGIKTYCALSGEENGETIVLLHGWGCDSSVFDIPIKHLEGHFKVYALDFAGFGKTDEPKTPWCVDDYVGFFLEFCKQCGITRTSLIAHSFGARVAIKTVTRSDCPIQIDKIILTGGAGIKPKKSLSAKLRTMKYKAGKRFLSLPPLKKMFPDAVEKSRKKHGSADYNAASPIMRQTLVKVVNEDLTSLLPAIKQPVLLFWGENDDATPLRDGQLMEKLIKDSGLVIAKGSGHYAFLEQWGYFSKVIDSFLEVR